MVPQNDTHGVSNWTPRIPKWYPLGYQNGVPWDTILISHGVSGFYHIGYQNGIPWGSKHSAAAPTKRAATRAPDSERSKKLLHAKATAEETKASIYEDVVGYDPESLDKVTKLLDEQAAQAYQMGVAPMNRMYAMMGMTGSGAHVAANNALAAS